MEILKKYENRKLYSTAIHKYVPLKYVADLVKTDQKFQVIDNKNGKNITKVTMKKALLDLDISTESIVELIRAN